MKALSVSPDYAFAIACGAKSVECRTWKTDYRGDLVICSTSRKYCGTVPGCALCVVSLLDVVPFTKKHLEPALMTKADYEPGRYAWILGYNRILKPHPVKGKLSLWEYDGPIDYIPEEEYLIPDGAEDITEGPIPWIEKYWRPYMV